MRTHRLLSFLLLLVTCFGGSAQRLLPWTVQQFLGQCSYAQSLVSPLYPGFAPPRVVDGREMVDAFISLDGEAAESRLRSLGVEVNCRFDGFVTARVPVDRLAEVSVMPGVADFQISPSLQLCTDSTMSVCHVNELYSGPSYGLPASYDGSGVIVGVIDYGFDYQHLAFKSGSDPSRTRIIRVYETQSNSGHPVHNADMGYLPGSVFMGDEIKALRTDNSSATHGTHTTGIAAGSRVGKYSGMAPGADIVLCAVSVLDGSMSAVEVANCVRYVDAYADSVGKPCVISMSVSTPSGQHDGLDYLSRAIKQTMGPGRIFVISAGNTAGRLSYAHKLASESDPLNLLLKFNSTLGDSTYYYGTMAADIWMRGSNVNNYFKLHVFDQRVGAIVWESPQLSSATRISSSQLSGYFDPYNVVDTMAYVKFEPSYVSFGKKYRLYVSARNLVSHDYTIVDGVKKGRYALGVTVYPRRTAPCIIDAWTGNTNSGFSFYAKPVKGADGVIRYPYYTAASDSCSIGTYAVGDSTISAGAFAARNNFYSLVQNQIVTDNTVTIGDIASYSSYQAQGAGPTGRALPDICAPGVNVVSAGSHYSYFALGSPYTVMNVNGNYWGVMSGTSMAAPTVAGIIALWLQADPELSVAQVREVFANTAQHDGFTSKRQFGPNGKIDALAGMRYVLEHFVPQPPAPIPGDVNGSGVVDIADVVALINYILTGKADPFDSQAADVTGDGLIDISDITIIIDTILGKR